MVVLSTWIHILVYSLDLAANRGEIELFGVLNSFGALLEEFRGCKLSCWYWVGAAV